MFKHSRFSKLYSLLFILIFAGLGTYLLWPTHATTPSVGTVSFNGDFETGNVTPWNNAQCANYGAPTGVNGYERGNFFIDNTTTDQGIHAGRVDLPANSSTGKTTSCLLVKNRPLVQGGDDYYGEAFYVPNGWTTGTNAVWGVLFDEFGFVNVWGAPVGLELHADHVTLGLQTGPCTPVGQPNPKCQWTSNADFGAGGANLPALYAVPRPMQTGVWHELITHIHWAADNTGQVEVWHKLKGQTAWTKTASLSGYPTLQWDSSKGCCVTTQSELFGAYRGYSTTPISVWLDNFHIGSSFSAVDATFGSTGGTLDTTPPTVSITSPSTTTVSGTVNVTASASDNVGVASVQFKLDGNNLGIADSTSPYTSNWATTGASNGNHTITATATDTSGNTAISSHPVTVNNVSTVDTTPPSVPSNLIAMVAPQTKVNLSWVASTDNVGVAGYHVYRNGSSTSMSTVAGTSYSDSSVTTNATYTYQVNAFDSAGNQSAKGNIASVTVADVPPPIGGSGNGPPPTVSGNITLVTPTVGAKKVTYEVDGKTVTSPTVNTNNLSDGMHTVEAVITEPNGKVVTKKETITVNNHQGFLKDAALKYGKSAAITGSTLLSFSLLAVIAWFLVFRKRPLLLHELVQETEDILHHPSHLYDHSATNPTPDYDVVHSGSPTTTAPAPQAPTQPIPPTQPQTQVPTHPAPTQTTQTPEPGKVIEPDGDRRGE